MRNFLARHWFLSTLALFIVFGLGLGASGLGPAVQPAADWVSPRWTTACVLFLMSYSLETTRLWAAFRAPGPVALGFFFNYGFIPALAWPVSMIQQTPDFRLGILIAASVPCTTAAASVMTRKANGNDAVSLLTTLSTNLSCFALTPMWLRWTAARDVELNTLQMMLDLVVAVLLPTVAGQLARIPSTTREFANRRKTPIGVTAQVLIEILVFTAALKAGTTLYEMQSSTAQTGNAANSVGALSLGLVWASCIAIHLAGLAGAWFASGRLGLAPAESAAVAFSGSQKTLPVGLYVAALFGPEYPFAMFPMLLYHASQLFLDTLIAAKLAARPGGRRLEA
jgi:solute carrier family 10 (sodium/bile acid cotransporter), member 7